VLVETDLVDFMHVFVADGLEEISACLYDDGVAIPEERTKRVELSVRSGRHVEVIQADRLLGVIECVWN
jgi:hypothetical protein